MLPKPKQIIGRRELVDFPELGITRINAKIDTGAYSNTLHCHDIHIHENKLYFKVFRHSDMQLMHKEHCFHEFSLRKIKNSFGEIEQRYIIKTKIKIAGRIINSIISLSDRTLMRYPVLIGRRLLKNKFIVDVSLKK